MEKWRTKPMAVASLHLDAKNPRLGRETRLRAPREIIQYLYDHDKAYEVAQSIATRGYFPNEPLLVVKESGQYVVVEGNRRLAALKALREPGLLDGAPRRQMEKLARTVQYPDVFKTVAVTIAPNRRATDKQIAGRHIGSPVLAWEAENRASFILEKLEEGYDNDELRDQLGFSLADIQQARQTRAIADMARSLDLPEEVKAKLDNPRANIFTTVARVVESTVGRNYLKVQPDPDHGLRGHTSKAEFKKAYARLVADIALGRASSRTLNRTEDIEKYFAGWSPDDLPREKRATFIPADIVAGLTVASSPDAVSGATVRQRPQPTSKSVIPKQFKVRYGSERLREIRDELAKLDRTKFPNAGAVLLRVFFELAVLDYLDRTGDLTHLVAALKEKGKLRQGIPVLKDLRAEIVRVAKFRLREADANRVEKAIRLDTAAPFGLDDLHSFVHQAKDFPGERDILQFWQRTEPLFQLMLQQPPGVDSE
jgi:ParB-like chromosome segregation protein Spo0J